MKLVCKKCKGTKFYERESITYTTNPPIPATIYECAECGTRVEVETRPIYQEPIQAQEIELGENQYVPSYLNADNDGTTTLSMTDYTATITTYN